MHPERPAASEARLRSGQEFEASRSRGSVLRRSALLWALACVVPASMFSAGMFSAGSALFAQDDEDAGTEELREIADEYLEDLNVDKRVTWVLDFKPIKVRMVTPRRGPKTGKTFWYLIYQIENKAQEDREVYLGVSADADRKQQYSDLFLPSVERAIEYQEKTPLWGKTDKFLKVMKSRDPADRKYSYETIKAGEKRLCVAVFNKFNPTSKNLTIRVKGLTNDVEAIKSPDGGDEVLLKQRVRVVHIRRPGDEYEFGNDKFQKMRMEWVDETIKLDAPGDEN